MLDLRKLYEISVVFVALTSIAAATSPTPTVNNSSVPFRHAGCFVDKSERTMSQWMGEVKSPWECYLKVKAKGWPAFGTQFKIECWSSRDADKTYNKYGATDICKNGMGAKWANDVYIRTDLNKTKPDDGMCEVLDIQKECSWVENGALVSLVSSVFLVACALIAIAL